MKSKRHELSGEMLSLCSYQAGAELVLHEYQRIDRFIVITRQRRTYHLAGEIELSERHCVVNASRDLLLNQCDAVLTVCPNACVQARVTAKIAKTKDIPEHMKSRITVCRLVDIDTRYISAWFDSVVNRDACLSPEETPNTRSEVCDE